MISALTGELSRIEDDRIHLRVGPAVCEVLVPAVDLAELHERLGEEITLHTLLYFQGDASGGNIEPRLLGFARPEDKRFFEKFITVKGIGPRTALRALTVPVGEIAHAIETKDARFLVRLDGIGKRTAELVIAELAGKVGQFATGERRGAAAVAGATSSRHLTADEERAIELLASPQMGLRRADAERLLLRAKQNEPNLESSGELVKAMLRLHGTPA